MFHSWRALTLAILMGGTLTGCHPSDSNQGGGGGEPSAVPSNQLPDSNEVNPSPRPDSYIDEHAAQKGEQKKRTGP